MHSSGEQEKKWNKANQKIKTKQSRRVTESRRETYAAYIISFTMKSFYLTAHHCFRVTFSHNIWSNYMNYYKNNRKCVDLVSLPNDILKKRRTKLKSINSNKMSSGLIYNTINIENFKREIKIYKQVCIYIFILMPVWAV